MIIKGLRTFYNNNNFFVSVDIVWEKYKYNFPSTLWFSTTEAYDFALTKDRFDAFLVGLVYPAIRNGETRIVVNGKISSMLYDNFNRYVSIFKFSLSVEPNYIPTEIKLEVDELDSNPMETLNDVGTGFSGGVDSLHAIHQYYLDCKIPSYKITKLFFFNVGSHGNTQNPRKAENLFYDRYRNMSFFAKEKLDLECIPLNSNMHEFHIWGHGRTESNTICAAILMLQPICSRYYVASAGWNYEQIFKHYGSELNVVMAIFDPILFPLLSTETLQIVSQGIECTRMEKVKTILDDDIAKDSMNVCFLPIQNGKINCGKCSKCQRTLLALDLFGKLDNFSKVFNLKDYKTSFVTKRYIARQIIRKNFDLYAKDFVEYAKLNKISLWKKTSVFAYLIEFVIAILRKSRFIHSTFLKYYRRKMNISE